MYWTDTSIGSPKIMSAWMNGWNQTVLVSTNINQPTGLTIDYHMNHRIFWCDSKANIIGSMKSDGTDRIIVRSGSSLLSMIIFHHVFIALLYHYSCQFYCLLYPFSHGSDSSFNTGIAWCKDFVVGCRSRC